MSTSTRKKSRDLTRRGYRKLLMQDKIAVLVQHPQVMLKICAVFTLEKQSHSRRWSSACRHCAASSRAFTCLNVRYSATRYSSHVPVRLVCHLIRTARLFDQSMRAYVIIRHETLYFSEQTRGLEPQNRHGTKRVPRPCIDLLQQKQQDTLSVDLLVRSSRAGVSGYSPCDSSKQMA